jgi:hypothetical protein
MVKRHWRRVEQVPAVRTALFVIGLFVMAASPAVGALPGPGGIIVFAAGLTLVLKYSGWAKRIYVRFKRSNPKKGEWADWGLRRRSARRRLSRQKQAEGQSAAEAARDD